MKRTHDQLDEVGCESLVASKRSSKKEQLTTNSNRQFELHNSKTELSLFLSGTTLNCFDPVYLEDNDVFYNLIQKETFELKRRELMLLTRREDLVITAAIMKPKDDINNNNYETIDESLLANVKDQVDEFKVELLNGEERHSLLSWMLKICEHQMCQDDIFPLATMILDKFLLFHPNQILQHQQKTTNIQFKTETQIEEDVGEFYNQDELNERQLYLFAACSLLLAAKLRQTPRLCIQVLIEFSKSELPVELNREEIFDGELLILATLKWDLAALVTPNDFLAMIMRKCQTLLSKNSDDDLNRIDDKDEESNDCLILKTSTTTTTTTKSNNDNNTTKTLVSVEIENEQQQDSNEKGCDFESRVRRHTQTLLELCLMGK